MFKKLLDNNKLGGLTCTFWKEGKVVYQESSGYKNLETREPMTIDALFRIASMTKPITSVLVMLLWEEQKLDLFDPITKWFPQFGNMKVLKNQQEEYEAAKRHITVLDLLTHRAGFTYSEFQRGNLRDDYLKVLGGDIDSELSNEQWINGLASLPLVNQSGELFNYGKSTDLLGMLISSIEGKSLGKVMKESKYGSIPCAGSIGSVGWPGAYGGWWSADPVKKTISLFLTHSMTEPQQLAQGIGFELYEAIDIFSNYCKAHSYTTDFCHFIFGHLNIIQDITPTVFIGSVTFIHATQQAA